MISLYESILKSTGSGKNFLKTYLIKEGWVYNPEDKTLRNRAKYPDISQCIQQYSDCDDLFVDIYIGSQLYRYDVVDLDDLKVVTDYWEAYNEVNLTRHKDASVRKKKSDAYKALKKKLKLTLTTSI